MKYRKYFIILMLLWSAIGDFFSAMLPVLGFIDEIISLLLLMDIGLFTISRRVKQDESKLITKNDIRLSKFGLLLLILFTWCFISFLINRSSLTQLFMFLFSISKGFILFYWIRTFIKESSLVSDILAMIKWLILIQVPFFVAGLIIYGAGYFGDFAKGAFITGDTSAVGTFFWLGIIITIAQYEQTGNKKFLLYTLGLGILLIITSTKQLTLLLPFVLLILYGKRIKIRQFKQLAAGICILGAAFFLYNFVESKWMVTYGVETSEANVLDYFNESEKLLGYYSLILELPERISYPLSLGAGPGMYGSYVAMNARMPLAEEFIMYYYDRIPEGLGGTLAYRSSSVIAFWGDIGLAGLLIILFIYFFRTKKSAASFKGNNPVLYNLVISLGVLMIVQSFILNVLEGNSFSMNLFWIICGISTASIPGLKNKNIIQ